MNELHHANIVLGKEDCRSFAFEILEKYLSFYPKANPDFLLVENTVFGIDDARHLERWAMGKPLTGDVKASVVLTKSITFEAQNGLLKVLEEPPLGTYIFLCLESLGGLIPTFLSRVRVMNASSMAKGAREPAASFGSKFIKSDIKERFSLIRSLSKKEDREDMLVLLKDLETSYYKNHIEKTVMNIPEKEAMKRILIAKVFSGSRGSSPKMLLEWLSCVL